MKFKVLVCSIMFAYNLYSQTANFTTYQKYRIQNTFGYADFGTSNVSPLYTFDFLTGLPILSGTGFSLGPFPFYDIATDKYGFAFDKNVISKAGIFSTGGNDLKLGFVSGGATPVVTPAVIIRKTNGKVGIGHSSPLTIDAKLDVRATGNMTGLSVITNHTNDYWANTWLTVNKNTSQALKISNSNYNGTGTFKDVFNVMGNGYTQIGVKAANGGMWGGVMLSVYGKVLARSFHVSIDPSKWADYVFDESYNLTPLTEVEAYYKTHQHLPEIPSAQEMGEKGNDLAETDILLLKKIEELTLYVVELNKQLDALNNKVKQLEKK